MLRIVWAYTRDIDKAPLLNLHNSLIWNRMMHKTLGHGHANLSRSKRVKSKPRVICRCKRRHSRRTSSLSAAHPWSNEPAADVRTRAHRVPLTVEVVVVVEAVLARAPAVVGVAAVAGWLRDGAEAVSGGIGVCQVALAHAGRRAEHKVRGVRRAHWHQPLSLATGDHVCLPVKRSERSQGTHPDASTLPHIIPSWKSHSFQHCGAHVTDRKAAGRVSRTSSH
jgi:hypothetical protein